MNNNIYKFGKKFLIRLFVIFYAFSSCNDDNFLDEKALDFLTVDNSYDSPDGILLGINGLHSLLRTDFFTLDVVYFTNYTDVAYSGENPSGESYTDNVIPDGSKPANFWNKAYKIIQQTNILLAAIDEISDDDWTSQEEKKAYIGEIKFFRAYAYRLLVYMFGDIPLQTEPVTTAKTDFVRTSKESVYTVMEEDLTFAATCLPKRGSEEAPGRITQGAAWHLLSEVYLAQEEYQNAVDAATHVIDDYGYALMTERFGNQPNLFGSENVYFDLFTRENHNLSENTEGIWVMQFEPDVNGVQYYMGPRAFGPKYYNLGTTPDGYKAIRGELYNGSYTGYSDTLSRPVAWARPTSYVLYDIWRSDWDNDFRNSEACIKRHFYFDNPESAYHGQEITWDKYEGSDYPRSSLLVDTVQRLYPYFMKVSTPCDWVTDLGRSGGGYTGKDFYVFRLAETYLLRAEGYLGLGKAANAAADINLVRNRSNASSVSVSDVTIDYILDERARELYTEENRLLTLLRLGKLYERVSTYNDNPLDPGLDIEEHNNLWPIPQDVIDLNTEGSIEQNPGY